MKECFKCHISEEKEKLFRVISKKGIVKVCKECFSKENLPLIKKPINPDQETFNQPLREKTLSQIPQKNNLTKSEKSWLIDNFHWVIMRKRRLKHITQKQLAKEINEKETTIKELEKGFISKYNFDLIAKIENYFEIKITKIKRPAINTIEEKNQEELKKIHSRINQDITISDLQKIKQKQETSNLKDNLMQTNIQEIKEEQKPSFLKKFSGFAKKLFEEEKDESEEIQEIKKEFPQEIKEEIKIKELHKPKKNLFEIKKEDLKISQKKETMKYLQELKKENQKDELKKIKEKFQTENLQEIKKKPKEKTKIKDLQNIPKKDSKKELTPDEINKLIFGK